MNFTIPNVLVEEDKAVTISLQYSHNPPVTVLSLSPDPFNDDTYPEPVTVTLSATPTSGYTVAQTYYKIDNGSQQTYSGSFTVSNPGEHTVQYWSEDNSGVVESHKTKTFTIHQNQAPVISELSDVSIISGATYTASGSFADSDSTNWSATVDYGEGAGAELLVLDANDFSLSHEYASVGEYTVTVQVHDDNGGVGTEIAEVTVLAPTATPTPTATLTPTDVPTATTTPTETPVPTATSTPTPTNTPTPTATPTSTPIPRQLTILSPAKVWVGLPSIAEIGTRFDLKADVYKDNTLISSGQVNSITAGFGLGGFTSARLNTIPFAAFTPVDFPTGSQLKLQLSVRNACSGSLRNSGTARLWVNDSQANSQFGATIANTARPYFMRDGFILATTAGSGPKRTIDVPSGARCSTFKSFGTWNITP